VRVPGPPRGPLGPHGSSGYRPPFAPHGPYGGGPPPPYPPGAAPQPPKPPRERSGLGAGTFSLIFVALGVVAILDLANVVNPGPSAYFAAALATVGLGLLVGAWFGRARWLIALGLALCAALTIATAAERWGSVDDVGADVVWTPQSVDELATRYENNFGNAVLDLSNVNFVGQDVRVEVDVTFGELDVILPPNVDVTASVDVNAGDAQVFDESWGGVNQAPGDVTDLGVDGRGGGHLRLDVHVSAGNVEVHR
jgi:Cell wall-active antibiotics response 4TMS YvqF